MFLTNTGFYLPLLFHPSHQAHLNWHLCAIWEYCLLSSFDLHCTRQFSFFFFPPLQLLLLRFPLSLTSSCSAEISPQPPLLVLPGNPFTSKASFASVRWQLHVVFPFEIPFQSYRSGEPIVHGHLHLDTRPHQQTPKTQHVPNAAHPLLKLEQIFFLKGLVLYLLNVFVRLHHSHPSRLRSGITSVGSLPIYYSPLQPELDSSPFCVPPSTI